ncbi:hypothetical protein SAMN04488074_12542 [Lentzea albidocapillata subsp. violacea]|uniref:SCO6045-like C-terminal domain-containing protein n=1 Tax=Lentzea albidocapillata subsp. violacea TaxID=128104 RepID=A0A1G9V879_9PSEU|nr:hypothetical protein [Lentzea albidocapillata]SDM68085.1 hypothetical protein SAMN04488074_12542 [Lentzea albidocapillata subsp. violacea]
MTEIVNESSLSSARERLAARQAELLNALLANGPAPTGFDEQRLGVERRALLSKRRGIVRMLGPEVADELGDRFRLLFDAYAAEYPRRAGSRAREDAAAFEEWCRACGELSEKRKARWKFWQSN